MAEKLLHSFGSRLTVSSLLVQGRLKSSNLYTVLFLLLVERNIRGLKFLLNTYEYSIFLTKFCMRPFSKFSLMFNSFNLKFDSPNILTSF